MEYGNCQDTVNATEASKHHFAPGHCKKLAESSQLVSLWAYWLGYFHARSCTGISEVKFKPAVEFLCLSGPAWGQPSPRVVSQGTGGTQSTPAPVLQPPPTGRHLTHPMAASRPKGTSRTLTVIKTGDKKPPSRKHKTKIMPDLMYILDGNEAFPHVLEAAVALRRCLAGFTWQHMVHIP